MTHVLYVICNVEYNGRGSFDISSQSQVKIGEKLSKKVKFWNSNR